MKTEEYRLNKVISKEKYCETNDCAVVALSVATGCGYEAAHKVFTELGRKRREGVPGTMTLKALKEVGFEADVIREPQRCRGRKSRYTMKTIGAAFDTGTYMVIVKDHIAAMVDGVIHDWSDGTKRQVRWLLRVTKQA